jgi:hypothetical protein
LNTNQGTTYAHIWESLEPATLTFNEPKTAHGPRFSTRFSYQRWIKSWWYNWKWGISKILGYKLENCRCCNSFLNFRISCEVSYLEFEKTNLQTSYLLKKYTNFEENVPQNYKKVNLRYARAASIWAWVQRVY